MNTMTDPTGMHTGDTPEAPTIGEAVRLGKRLGLDTQAILNATVASTPDDIHDFGEMMIRGARDLRQAQAQMDGRRVLIINRGPQKVDGPIVMVLDQVTAAGAELSYTSISRGLPVGARWGDAEFQFEALGHFEILTTWSDETGSHMMVAEVLA